ncbi:MAG: hypothetical protein JSV92_02610 [archaeon]|nr:MAG: hypothetical protein JSV92_02610 [archaeon]
MKYGKELLVSIAICTLILAFTQFAPATEDEQSSEINVTVGSSMMIDLTPASFTWEGGEAIDPGATGAVKQAQIENIGSVNITTLWFNVSQPTSNPYGTGTASNYESSNFLWIARETGNYYAVDRLEFNETRSLIYLKDPDGNSPPNSTKWAYGRFRNASQEWFWMFDKTGDTCVSNDFYIGDVAHTQTTTGTVDFSGAGVNDLTANPASAFRYGSLTDSGDGWCYADIIIGNQGGGLNYTIAVDNTTLDRVRWSHWNTDLPGSGTFVESFYSGTLYPGNSTVANITIHLSYGVKEGALGSGELFVIASDA